MTTEYPTKFHVVLKGYMDDLVHLVYDASQSFPKEEQFGLTSQLRRAALSIVLNYVEGYARQRKPVLKNFLEISYGSLKETNYLLTFSYKRKYLTDYQHQTAIKLCDNIGKMLWGTLIKL